MHKLLSAVIVDRLWKEGEALLECGIELDTMLATGGALSKVLSLCSSPPTSKELRAVVNELADNPPGSLVNELPPLAFSLIKALLSPVEVHFECRPSFTRHMHVRL